MMSGNPAHMFSSDIIISRNGFGGIRNRGCGISSFAKYGRYLGVSEIILNEICKGKLHWLLGSNKGSQTLEFCISQLSTSLILLGLMMILLIKGS